MFHAVSEQFADERDVELVVVRAPSPTLSATAEGVITDFDCFPRYGLRSGTSPLAIDGEPKLALATEVPPWRNFVSGTRGNDVAALQRELKRLGYFPASPTSRYDLATKNAVAKLFERVTGRRLTANSLMMTSIIWLPTADTVVEKCEASVGARVSAGTPIASIRGAIHTVEMKAPPADIVPGKRELIVGDQVLVVNQSGAITDNAGLARFASSDQFRIFEESNGQSGLRAKYRLTEPKVVYSVPPSAILFSATGNACVVTADGQSARVSVVSSTLGRSLVEAATGIVWPEVQLEPSPESTCI
ncbi:peptidoglycan-binding domain-containing protein [Micromonospora sp. NPDC049230]|uniref:peptidoglycan-binding domain-containing protein n=1 Tax=Micromonospora sp. NPDC049230 TaxID=3155502 RepID=UPI0033F919A3